MLKEIIVKQKEFQSLVDKHSRGFDSLEHMVISYMSAIVGETDEVNREVNYKWWKQSTEVNEENLHEEIADIFLFWLDLCIRMGIDEEIFNTILVKQDVNIQRQLGNIKGREDYQAQLD